VGSESTDIPLFPIAGWDIGITSSGDSVLLRILYLSMPSSEPNQGLMYAMTPDQARELATELNFAALKMQETDDPCPDA
jgi:hypothetical protein